MTTFTCTIVTAVDGRCGQPAVVSFTSRSGVVYHECAEHAVPGQPGLIATPRAAHPHTRTTAPFVLVRDGKIVGYAHSTSEAVAKRAARLGAKIVPVVAS